MSSGCPTHPVSSQDLGSMRGALGIRASTRREASLPQRLSVCLPQASRGHVAATTAAATMVLLPEAREGQRKKGARNGPSLPLPAPWGPVFSPWAEGGASLEANSVCSRGSLPCWGLPLSPGWTRPPHPGLVVFHILSPVHLPSRALQCLGSCSARLSRVYRCWNECAHSILPEARTPPDA